MTAGSDHCFFCKGNNGLGNGGLDGINPGTFQGKKGDNLIAAVFFR
jgi:hypothetical protein